MNLFKSALILAVLFFLIIISISCSDKNNIVDSFDILPLEEFPTQIGTFWKYEIYDSLVSQFDTLIVSISGSKHITADSLPVSVWTYQTKSSIDTLYAYINGDTLFYYKTVGESFYIPHMFIFPLKANSTWDHNLSSYEVTGIKPVVTHSGTYTRAFHLRQSTTGLNEYSFYNFWLVHDRGPVFYSEREILWTENSNETWNLVAYIRPQYFSLDKFPNHDGISWTYEISDIFRDIIDTVTVQVAESALVAVWLYDFGDSSYTELVSTENDVINFVTQGRITIVRNSIHFPITLGDSWETYPLGNKANVEAVQDLQTTAGSFFPTYRIRTLLDCGDECSHVTIEWYAPQVGMVNRTFSYTGFSLHPQEPDINIQYSWRLIDYNFRD